ncbi:MAG TPA: type 1 glutamine amidotransferase domain-containing protein [Caulobacteraceae bacterium]
MNILIVVTSAASLAPAHPTGLWLEEFAIPYTALAEVGIVPTVASPKGGAAPIDPKTAPDEAAKLQWRAALEALSATIPLAEVSAADFDALYIPGGHGPMVDLAKDSVLTSLIEAFDRAGKPIAALCHGPAALVAARAADGRPLLAGRKATGFTNGEETAAGLAAVVPFLLETRMREAGALFEHALIPGAGHVVADGALLTGQNPASSTAMARALAETLAARQRAALAAADTAT